MQSKTKALDAFFWSIKTLKVLVCFTTPSPQCLIFPTSASVFKVNVEQIQILQDLNQRKGREAKTMLTTTAASCLQDLSSKAAKIFLISSTVVAKRF